MNDLKNKTTKVLYDYYNKVDDVSLVIKVTREMLKSNNSNPIIRGEICETLLLVMIKDFIKKNNLQEEWIISKGLILKDLDNTDSDYLTELDLTLFTPKKIYLFECKSYKGSKVLRDPCRLYVKSSGKENFKMDVYEQHSKHYKALFKYLKDFKLKNEGTQKPFKIVLFDFSDGNVEDLRSENFKSIFPIRDELTLYSLFKYYNKEPNQWDMRYIRKVVSILNENKKVLTSSHLDYVSNLAINRNKKK